MNIDVTSDFMFTLADKYGIAYASNKYRPFSNEEYNGYLKEYKELSSKRDETLRRYLVGTPNRIRTFVPWVGHVLDTVLQIQWYYDEVVLHDPVYILLSNFLTENTEENKVNLSMLLNGMKRLRESMQAGFLLFGSYEGFNQGVELSNQSFDDFLSLQEVQEECALLPEWYQMEVPPNAQGTYLPLRGIYRGKQTFFFDSIDLNRIKEKAVSGFQFNFVGTHKLLDEIELRNRNLLGRCFEAFKNDYHREIAETLRYIEIAPKIQTPILFDRKLDQLIVSLIQQNKKLPNDIGRDFYNLILPYVDGIPHEHLFDLRGKMPDAFLDFRSAMFDIISELRKEGVDESLLALKIRQKVNPIIKHLDVEIKNTLTNAKIMGISSPLAPAVGTLGLTALGIDVTKYIELLGGGGALVGLSTFVNYITENRTHRTNDFYYLWKAQKSKSLL